MFKELFHLKLKSENIKLLIISFINLRYANEKEEKK